MQPKLLRITAARRCVFSERTIENERADGHSPDADNDHPAKSIVAGTCAVSIACASLKRNDSSGLEVISSGDTYVTSDSIQLIGLLIKR